MGLLKIIRKLKIKEKEMRILLLGLDNSGKTTILKKLSGEDIQTIAPTLGFSINTIQINDYKLNIWDVGGQRSLRPFWNNYFESTDGLIYVVDSTDKMRLNDAKNELRTLLNEQMLHDVSLLIFANKQDIPGALKCQDIEAVLELNTIKTHKWKIISCSAFTGENLNDGIDWIINEISERIFNST